MRDKKRVIINTFFTSIKKVPDEISTADVRKWYQTLLDRNLSENYIYAGLSHLSGYFEGLRSLPDFSYFIKINPVRPVMPKNAKKYNPAKIKALTGEEISKLWLHIDYPTSTAFSIIADKVSRKIIIASRLQLLWDVFTF